MKIITKFLLITCVCIFNFGWSNAQELKSFYSEAMERDMEYYIYFPPSYETNPGKYYPVLYFYHGSRVGPDAYLQLVTAVDVFIKSENIDELILVMPNAQAEPYFGSFYTNSALYGNFEDYLTKDLIDHIENEYRAKKERQFRGLLGHSMGGYGAMKHLIKHSDLYAVGAAHSGPVNITLWDDVLPLLREENGNNPPFVFKPNEEMLYTTQTFTMAGAFSPNLDAKYKVDYPIDENGELVQSVLERWQPHNPAQLAKQLTQENAPVIYFDCGTEDNYKLLPQNQSLSDSLKKYNIEHQFETFEGGHTDQLVYRIAVSIRIIDEVFKNPSTKIKDVRQASSFISKIYPIPATDYLIVESAEIVNEPVNVQIISTAGQVIWQNKLNPDSEWTIPTNNFGKGSYFLHIYNDKIFQIVKFIK